jgi:hypothetical protein
MHALAGLSLWLHRVVGTPHDSSITSSKAEILEAAVAQGTLSLAPHPVPSTAVVACP